MKYLLIISLFLFQIACLRPRKSAFDFNGPSGFGFGAIIFALSNGGSGTATYSIGGNITGFTSGTLILQLNGASDLILNTATTYLFNNVPSGAYIVSVKSHPIGLTCELKNHTGNINSNITNANITCTNFVKADLYPNTTDPTKSYWLDYIKSNGTSPVNATGADCIPANESGFYNACIHTGEFKKFTIPNLTSCTGITAEDHLKTLNWNCFVQNGVANIISTGLRDDKGLSDLIDFTTATWKDNYLIVTRIVNGTGTRLMQTNPAKWWDNAIEVNDGGGALSISETIYIAKNSSTSLSIYNLSTKTALLVQPGIIKSFTSSFNVSVSGNTSFTWIEGSLQGSSGGVNSALSYTGIGNKFNVVRKFKVIGNNTTAIYNANGTTASMFHDVSGTNLSANGHFFVQEKGKNILNHIQAYNIGGRGIDFVDYPDNIILNSITMNSNGIGIHLSATGTPTNDFFLNNGAFNSGPDTLIYIDNTASRTTMLNTLAANRSGARAIYVAGNNSKFINTVAAHAASNLDEAAIMGLITIYNGIFKGTVNGGSACTAGAITSGIMDNDCTKRSPSEISPTSVTGITLASSFVGKVTTTDSKNTSNTIGVSAGTPTDWLNFENRFRGWGKLDANPFPNASHTGRCSASNCQIWDWSLKATDSVARNVNHCPSGSITDTHQWSTSNQNDCNTNFKGAVFNVALSTCTTTFLRNATEIFGDGIGNENGICESNEDCMYTPNIGAYQGHSSDANNPSKLIRANETSSSNTTRICEDVTTGTVSNVKLWKFDTNGR